MKISPNSLEKAVRKEFSGCVEKALLAIRQSDFLVFSPDFC